MSSLRSLLALPGAVAALVVSAGPVAAATFDVTYDWGDARYGAQGWRADNAPPGGSAAGPWYASSFVAGSGLSIDPTGNGGVPYRNARGTWAWDPPPGATIRRVRLRGVSGTAMQRQFGRVWLVIEGEPADARTGQRELTYDGSSGPSPSESWVNRSFTFSAPAGMRGLGFVMWLYTIPCEGPDDSAACVNASPDDGPTMQLGSASFTLDDPSAPSLVVTGLPDPVAWTRNRRFPIEVTATDGQSGVAEVTATAAGGGSTRTVRLGHWDADRYNAAPRLPGTPPLAAGRTVDGTVTVAASGTTRVSLRARNGAGMQATYAIRVRVDRERPTLQWPSSVRPGSTVRTSDPMSAVETAVLEVDGRERDRCVEARTCRLRVPSDVADRSTVSVEVRDRAGNQRSGARAVRVPGVANDRRRPTIAWPRSLKPGSVISVADDRSGIADAVLTVGESPEPAARCGDGRRHCTLRLPRGTDGQAVHVRAQDRAGNQARGERRVRGKREPKPRAPRRPVPGISPDGFERICGPAARYGTVRGGLRRVAGGDANEAFVGSRSGDRLDGGAGEDCLVGLGGQDELDGGSGDDRIDPGPGRDEVNGGSGDDLVFAADGARDIVQCSDGDDEAFADRSDETYSCEKVTFVR